MYSQLTQRSHQMRRARNANLNTWPGSCLGAGQRWDHSGRNTTNTPTNIHQICWLHYQIMSAPKSPLLWFSVVLILYSTNIFLFWMITWLAILNFVIFTKNTFELLLAVRWYRGVSDGAARRGTPVTSESSEVPRPGAGRGQSEDREAHRQWTTSRRWQRTGTETRRGWRGNLKVKMLG